MEVEGGNDLKVTQYSHIKIIILATLQNLASFWFIPFLLDYYAKVVLKLCYGNISYFLRFMVEPFRKYF